jgi:hypothetical protein
MESGDHICVRRLLGPIPYMHHGIYISRSEVIHFDGANRDPAARRQPNRFNRGQRAGMPCESSSPR